MRTNIPTQSDEGDETGYVDCVGFVVYIMTVLSSFLGTKTSGNLRIQEDRENTILGRCRPDIKSMVIYNMAPSRQHISKQVGEHIEYREGGTRLELGRESSICPTALGQRMPHRRGVE